MLFKGLVFIVLAAFGAFSTWVMLEIGYFGIWQAGIANVGALQVLLDLVIVCGLGCVWTFADARRHGVNPWPFVLITIFAGSFGLLLYLLVRPTASRLSERFVAD